MIRAKATALGVAWVKPKHASGKPAKHFEKSKGDHQSRGDLGGQTTNHLDLPDTRTHGEGRFYVGKVPLGG